MIGVSQRQTEKSIDLETNKNGCHHGKNSVFQMELDIARITDDR